uniref:LUD_dom domain-containing protein n=1 Tax=Rhabditophanes sp. KR3021 TaxID=114890 RepID=A0AC35TTR8_9BILA
MSGSRLISTYQNRDETPDRLIGIKAECASKYTGWNKLNEVEDVIKCLKETSAENIVNSLREVEKDFVIKDIEELAEEVRAIPLMTGTTEQELMASISIVKNFDNGTKYVDKEFLKFYSVDICVEAHDDTYKAKHIVDEMRYFITAVRDPKNAIKNGAPAYVYNYEYIEKDTSALLIFDKYATTTEKRFMMWD